MEINLHGFLEHSALEHLFVHYYIADKGDVTIKLYDLSGKLVKLFDEGSREQGVYQSLLNIESLPPGQMYILEINSLGKSIRTKIIKK